MSILSKLATSLNRRDEVPNQELAREIAATEDKTAVAELVTNLGNKNKNLQSDCIKTLYEIGYLNPDLLAEYYPEFLHLLNHKNNRMVWGAMIALNSISKVKPAAIYENLPAILEAAEKGSVITKDHAINILINLAALPQFADNALALLLEQFQSSPTNQLPAYAENALPIISAKWKPEFARLLTNRLPEIEKESKQKRVAKVLKKLL